MIPPPDRSELLLLLSEACELEQGLACSYLFAAFSLKQDLAEGGLTWDQMQKVRLWAAQIYHVAAEEMLHLASAWNIQAAIGGVPWHGRPNFPQASNYYPLHLPLETRPFSLATLDRFLEFEHPSDPKEPPLPPRPLDPARDFRTVGELYRTIRGGILSIPERELFIGNPDNQVGPELMDFPDLVPVVDRRSACRAIETIVEQGEGCGPDAADSHYAIFRRIRREYLEESLRAESAGTAFAPVRPCISNPTAWRDPHLGAPNSQLVSDVLTVRVVALFDSVYSLMLRLLQYVFDSSTRHGPLLQCFSTAALRLMMTVVKPLGEALTVMPAGPEYGAATAGPSFTLGRLVPLPHDPAAAVCVAREKLAKCLRIVSDLASDPKAPAKLGIVAARLAAITVNPIPENR